MVTYKVFFATLFFFYAHAALRVPSADAQSLSGLVSDILRQRLETWKAPPPEVIPLSADETAGVCSASLPQNETTDRTSTSFGSAPTGVSPATTVQPPLMVKNERIRAAIMLARFYEGRAYRPAWSNDTGPLPYAEQLLTTIHTEAEREGLQLQDYRLALLSALIQEAGQPQGFAALLDPHLLADLELLLTDTFLTYAARVSVGKVKLDALDPAWFEKRQKADLVQVLQTAVESDQVADTLKTLPPSHPGYRRLRDALLRYRNLALQGGWPQISEGPTLRPGDREARVIPLRARLRTTGDLPLPGTQSPNRKKAKRSTHGGHDEPYEHSEKEVFDTTLVQAVRRFQRRHGLPADGVVGAVTLAALNVPADIRVRQIATNMERWRRLPQELGPRHIAVNIPNFALAVVENGQAIMTMKVVVGKMMEQQNTPIFSASMTHLVLNPYWYVPKSIAEKELFPLSRKDPEYFARHNFRVRRVLVGEKQHPDPNASDGSTTATKVYEYRLRQGPGPKNSLGRIKFMFPNPHGVYLHDTPSKDLFNRTIRTFSHGCIRIEKPVDLAEYILRGTDQWTRQTILATIEQQKERTVWLPEPIPVYIQYWTTWVDHDGIVQFRSDIYEYDRLPGARLPTPKPNPPPVQVQPEPQPPLQLEVPPATQAGTVVTTPPPEAPPTL